MTINLLPEKEKKELEMEMVWRKVLLILVFILVFLSLLTLSLFALRTYIITQTEELKTIVSEKRLTLENSGFQNFKTIINQANENLQKLQKFRERQILLTPLIEKLGKLKPPTIYFTTLSFQKKLKEIKEKESDKIRQEVFAEFYISGWADTRETLFLFKKKLAEVEEFKGVYFTPSSWISPSDVNFSFSFQIKVQ